MNIITNKSDSRRILSSAAIAALAALPLLQVSALGDPYQAPRALVAALLLAVAIGFGPSRLPAGWRTPAVLASALVVAYTVAAARGGFASAVFGVHGRYQGLILAGVLLLAGFVGALVGRRAVLALSWALAVSAVAQSAVLTVQVLTGNDPGGTTANAVLTGGWLAVAAATVFAAGLTVRGWRRRVFFAAASVAAIGVGMTGSRGAWVGLLLGLAAAVLLMTRTRPWIAVAMVGALVVGVIVGGPTATSKLAPDAFRQGSAAARAQIWSASGRMVADFPALGVGPGRFLYEYPAYQTAEHARIEPGDVRADQAHGELLHAAVECGIVAAVLLAAMFGLATVRAARASGRRDGAALIAVVGLAAYMGQATFGIATVETGTLGWLLLGVALSSVAEGDARPHASSVAPTRWAATAFGVAIAAACAMYVVADARFADSQRSFASGDMEAAAESAKRASQLLPVVDVFRVAEADAAMYTGGFSLDEALRSVDAGLALEPDSYDLLIARARLLGAMGAPADKSAEAFMRALSAYPQGVEARQSAMRALRAAGRDAEAARLERGTVQSAASGGVL